MEQLCSSELSIQGKQPDTFQEATGSNKSKKHFFGRGITATLMIIPQLIINIGLGTLKGLQVGTCKPGEFMFRQVKKIGTADEDELRRFWGYIGAFAGGVIVGIAVAVPSLLIGAVVGLIRGICKTPDAMKTCFNHGCFEAVKRTKDCYLFDTRKIAMIVTTTLIIASTAFVLTLFVLIGFPALLSILLIPFVICLEHWLCG